MWGSAPACVERGLCDEHGPCSLAPGKQLPLGLGSRVSTSEGGTGVSEANTSGFVDTVGSSHTGFSPRQHDGAGSGEPLDQAASVTAALHGPKSPQIGVLPAIC